MTGIFLYIIGRQAPPAPHIAVITTKRLTAQNGVLAEGGAWQNPSRADFVMRYIIDLKRIGEVMKNPEYSMYEKVLLYIITDHYQYCMNTGKVCELSYSTIKKWTGWGWGSISKTIKSLAKRGDITADTEQIKGNMKSTTKFTSIYAIKGGPTQSVVGSYPTSSRGTTKTVAGYYPASSRGTTQPVVGGTTQPVGNNNNKNNNKQMEKKENEVGTAGTQPGKAAYDPNGFNEGELEIMRELGFSTPEEWKRSFASCERKHTPKGYNPNEYNERELECMRKGVI